MTVQVTNAAAVKSPPSLKSPPFAHQKTPSPVTKTQKIRLVTKKAPRKKAPRKKAVDAVAE